MLLDGLSNLEHRQSLRYFDTEETILTAGPLDHATTKTKHRRTVAFHSACGPLIWKRVSSTQSQTPSKHSVISIPSCQSLRQITDFTEENGEFLVVLDDPSRENEADLIIAAQDITTSQMGFMVHHSSGLICAPIIPSRADALLLPPMVQHSEDPRGTAYTISVDAADESVTTGISAHDRALTCRVLAEASPNPSSLRRPGHVLPLRSVAGGVQARPGHTEAAIEFCRLAGKAEAAVICELVDEGQGVPGKATRENVGMLKGEACIAFAKRWGLKVCTIEDLVHHIKRGEGELGANGSLC